MTLWDNKRVLVYYLHVCSLLCSFTPSTIYRLQYDNVTNTYYNTDGVKTRIPGFGNTSGIEYLDPHTKEFGPTVYFHPMVGGLMYNMYLP